MRKTETGIGKLKQESQKIKTNEVNQNLEILSTTAKKWRYFQQLYRSGDTVSEC